jgi:nitrogen-specific signal transduction histidine kinase
VLADPLTMGEAIEQASLRAGAAQRSAAPAAQGPGLPDRERFAAWILGSMTSGIVGIDTEAAVVSFNAGAQRILGCPQGDLAAVLGRDCREVLAEQPVVARLLIETLERGSPLSRAELVLESVRDRPASTIGFTLSPVRDAQERVCGAAILFRDLTPIERSDEQVRLRERLAALGQMAAGMAHEICNPLAGMEVLAGLLKRRLGDRPEEQALVAELIGELRALADTVTASLDFVRPVTPVRGLVDPARLLDESVAMARARVPFAGVVERHWDAALPALFADEDQLRTVLTNLVVNAFEAMAEGGAAAEPRLGLGLHSLEGEPLGRSLRVGGEGNAAAEVPPREIVITVSDTGPGLPVELREKVFYPFFTTKQDGSGVGLATAQKIVASHGGSLELESRPGEGCVFRIRLPLETGEAR